MRSGPSRTVTDTASRLSDPRPASSVSSMCCSKVSRSESTAAMPPLRVQVLLSERLRLVSTATEPVPAASSANDRPATPPPSTRKSNRWGMECSCNAPQPGGNKADFLRFRRRVR